MKDTDRVAASITVSGLRTVSERSLSAGDGLDSPSSAGAAGRRGVRRSQWAGVVPSAAARDTQTGLDRGQVRG